MKKHLILALTFLCILCSIILLTGCNSQTKNAQYKINFLVENDLYAKTTVSEGIIKNIPDNPKKDKFTFQGWYFDNNQWDKPLTLQSILDLPITSDMTINVYAYFTPYNCADDNKDHNFIEESSISATCTQNGVTNYVCTICGFSYNQTIYATGHSCDKSIVKEATCSESGLAHFSCKNCDYKYDEEISALNHVFGNLQIVKPAKCTQDGEGYRHCSRCEKNITETIPHINHKLDNTKHCINSGCDYFELFNCSIVINSQFGTHTENFSLEYGKSFTIAPKTYEIEQLKFKGYYSDEEKISDHDGKFTSVYQGQKTITIEAKYYYAVHNTQDLINLQTNTFFSDYFANQKNGEFLCVELKNDIDFNNTDWQPVKLKGKTGVVHGFITLNGNNHILKNYYSSKGGLFDRVQSAENIVFENVKINITNLSASVFEGYYTLGLLSNYAYSIENITVKSGEIIIAQSGDTDLGVAGICGQVRIAKNCINRANITTNTPIASGIVLIADNVTNCFNYGNITTGEYIVSPSIITMGTYSYIGTSGICNQLKTVKNCINYGDVRSLKFGASGIALFTTDKVEECSNLGNITSENANSSGISIMATSADFFCNISNCSNYGRIKGNNYSAGIACFSIVVTNCYNTGDVESNEYAGGITANFAGLLEPIKYCYNIGKISGKKGCFGGIVGKSNKSILFKCINIDDNFAADEHTQNQCKVIESTDEGFIELEYESSIWQFNGNGKPTLKWESEYKV